MPPVLVPPAPVALACLAAELAVPCAAAAAAAAAAAEVPAAAGLVAMADPAVAAAAAAVVVAAVADAVVPDQLELALAWTGSPVLLRCLVCRLSLTALAFQACPAALPSPVAACPAALQTPVPAHQLGQLPCWQASFCVTFAAVLYQWSQNVLCHLQQIVRRVQQTRLKPA